MDETLDENTLMKEMEIKRNYFREYLLEIAEWSFYGGIVSVGIGMILASSVAMIYRIDNKKYFKLYFIDDK